MVEPLGSVTFFFTAELQALCVCSTRPMKLREKKYITLMSLLNISGSTSMAGI